MRAGDHFKIASLTKSYTAAVILQLVGEGKLRLNQSVEHWLPGLVPNGDGITIRNLLQHTSGLFDFEADERVLQPYLQGDFGHYWSPLELVQMALSHEPLFPPGADQSYSNTNYVLLGMVVEAIDGKSIGEALNDRLFEPLGLDETSYPTEPGLPSPYAHGYLALGDGPPVDVTGISPSLSPASGAIVATAVDVSDFYRALLSGDLLKPKLLRAMKATIPVGTPGDIPGQRYGLGLERFPTSCGPAWGHNGAVPGYLSYSFNSGNGARQALLMVNMDASSFPSEAADLYFTLLEKAFCGVA
jgi:D-alanyl-D-alanine carboxypeptidase